jgi:hypothetical protein
MLRVSAEGEFQAQWKALKEANASLPAHASTSFFKLKQQTSEASLLYGKCIADRTVDLWNFSTPHITKEIGIREGEFSAPNAIVLDTPKGDDFIRYFLRI